MRAPMIEMFLKLQYEGEGYMKHWLKRKLNLLLVVSVFMAIVVPFGGVASAAAITVNTASVVNTSFKGFGYQMDPFYFDPTNKVHNMGDAELNEVVKKQWMEQRPGYARVGYNLRWFEPFEGTQTVNSEEMLALYKTLDLLKSTNTFVYFSTWYAYNPIWLGNGSKITDPVMRGKFARSTVDFMDYLITTKGYTNIKSLSLDCEMGSFRDGITIDYVNFVAHNQAVRDQLTTRGKSGLFQLAGSDDPFDDWFPLHYLADNYNPVFDEYNAHQYDFDETPGHDLDIENASNYTFYMNKFTTAANKAKSKSKEFFISEFGTFDRGGSTFTNPAQDDNLSSLYFGDTAVAVLNSGSSGAAKWLLVDSEYPQDLNGRMFFGGTRAYSSSYKPKASNFSYGLITKYIRPGSTVYTVTSNDPNLRVAAVKNNTTGKYTLLAVNRNSASTTATFTLSGTSLNSIFRKYTHYADQPSRNAWSDLDPYAYTIASSAGSFSDTVAPQSITIYTEDYDTTNPNAVTGLTVANDAGDSGVLNLSWTASTSTDLSYYRIYRSSSAGFTPSYSNQVGSTVATAFTDNYFAAGTALYYKVIPVDHFGNVGTAVQASGTTSATNTFKAGWALGQGNSGTVTVQGNSWTKTDAGLDAYPVNRLVKQDWVSYPYRDIFKQGVSDHQNLTLNLSLPVGSAAGKYKVRLFLSEPYHTKGLESRHRFSVRINGLQVGSDETYPEKKGDLVIREYIGNVAADRTLQIKLEANESIWGTDYTMVLSGVEVRTVPAAQQTSVPQPFTISFPRNTFVSSTTPLLKWTYAPYATSYEINIWENGTTLALARGGLIDTQYQVITADGLKPNTLYQWYVRAVNGNGDQYPLRSGSWFKTNSGPSPSVAAFSLTSPSDGATGISAGPVLTWGSAGTGKYYDVFVYSKGLPARVFKDLTTTSVSLTGNLALKNGSTYKWAVVAKDATEYNHTDLTHNVGSWRSFTTSGTAPSSSGTHVEGEDYGADGPGVSYSDASAFNGHIGYRLDESVDTGYDNSASNGAVAGALQTGEWLVYPEVSASTSKTYNFDFRLYSVDPGTRQINVIVDGISVGTVNVPNTGGNYQTVAFNPNVSLSAGLHTVKLVFTGWMSLDSFRMF